MGQNTNPNHCYYQHNRYKHLQELENMHSIVIHLKKKLKLLYVGQIRIKSNKIGKRMISQFK